MQKNMFKLMLVVCLYVMGLQVTIAGEYSKGILDRTKILATALDISPEKYPDSDTVIVGEASKVFYNTDGTYVQWSEMYIKILTEKGRRANTTISSHFTIPYQRGTNDCSVDLVEIIKSNGERVAIDVAAQSRVMVNPSSMSANIYNPNDKIIRVNVADLEVGDILHFVMFDRTVQARMADTWSDWLVLEGTQPILYKSIEISAPKKMPLRSIALKSEVAGTVTASKSEEAGRLIYRWEVKDVPRMFPEPKMPSPSTVVQRLMVSTIPDWQTVSKWYWNISEPHYEASPEMRKKVVELTAGIKDKKEQINKIFRFVSQEIRYMGITVEDTAPGYEPHDVKDTFKDRHGVCRDKAGLLVVMLRLAEFKAFPVLISVGPRKDEEVPQPFFNHAIVAVLGDDGKYILMDPTNETTAQLLPAYLNYMSYLVARPEGETLLTSPIDPAESNMVQVKTTGKVTADGDIECETVLDFGGINDNAYRGYFARSKPEDRLRFMEGVVRRRIPGAHVVSFEITPSEIMDMTVPLSIRVVYEATDILVAGDENVMLPLPILGTSVGVANNVIGGAGLEKRKYPLKSSIACGVNEQIKINLPSELGDVVAMPENDPIVNDAFEWKMEVSQSGSDIELSSVLKLKTVEFSPEEYLVLKDALKNIQVALRKMPILTSAVADSDADVLIIKDDVSYELIDDTHWTKSITVVKKVLTYAGKKKSGEIKLYFNPELENVYVKSAIVTSKDGTEHVLSEKEINEMDAPWVGAAPRYPAGKILVVSLPAVEVGSVIKYCIVREKKKGQFFSMSEAFNSTDPIEEAVVTVSMPADLAMIVDQESFTGSYTNYTTLTDSIERVVMSWSNKDASPVKMEDMLPPWWQFNDTVFLSTGNWSDYTKTISSVLNKAAKKSRVVGRATKDILKKERDAQAKVRLIRDYVATHIRRAGPGLSQLPLTAISSAEMTLNDAYGNTTDLSVLLHAMLQSAGFDPEFVLASSLPNIESTIDNIRDNPRAGVFNSVLVRLSDSSLGLAAGEYIYLNDTDQYAVLGASAYEGSLGLVLGSGMIEEIIPAKRSKLKSNYAMSISETGDAVITKRVLFYGAFYGAKKKQYAEMTPEKLDRYFQSLISGVSQGATRVGKLVHDFSEYPGMVTFTVRVPDYAIVTGDKIYFKLPESLAGLFSLRSDKRINPMYQAGQQDRELVVKVELPTGYRVAIKPDAWSCSDVGGLDLDITVGDQPIGNELYLKYRATAVIEPSVISPAHYSALLDIDKRLAHKR
ncbi:MAG: DUF3857 domain-containing protein, partial [Kiritimatiellae bacterium]|nr:DUF3857 domain-containing protein [Kiritimatiellia bacterium]